LSEKEKPNLVEIIKANRKLILALFGMPIIGMVIALALVLYKRPDNLMILVAVIFFLIIQYGVLMIYFNNRIEKLLE
jgi:heme/copper-type cytochrome/quinol oxidase subunit 4